MSYFTNIVIPAAVASGATSSGQFSDSTMGIILLVAGLLFFFLIDGISLCMGQKKGYKKPKVDIFRVFGIIELIGSAYYFSKAFL